jgi:hypothetical protein
MAKKMGLVVVAALALAAPGAASATPGQDTGKDASCGVGPNGKAPNSQSGGDHLTPPFGSPQSFGCDSSTKARRPIASAAQAGTIRLGPFNEVDDERSQRQQDNDNSGGNSAGDTITGRFFLEKRGRRVGVVRYKGTIVALTGSVAQLRDEYTATIRRQGNVRGGHLFGVYEHTEDFNQRAKVGDVDRIPITRGDGRFAGYTGVVNSRVVRVAGNGQPFYRDTIVLKKQQ